MERYIRGGGRSRGISGELDEAFPGVIRPSPSSDLARPLRDEMDRAVEEALELERVVVVEVVVGEFEFVEGFAEADELEADEAELADDLDHVLDQPGQPDRPAKDRAQLLKLLELGRVLQMVVRQLDRQSVERVPQRTEEW